MFGGWSDFCDMDRNNLRQVFGCNLRRLREAKGFLRKTSPIALGSTAVI
jgi:hypothetical protein